MANATCTARGHHWSPEHTSKEHATILLDATLECIISCTKVDQSKGQRFNQCAMDATAVWLPHTHCCRFVDTATQSRFRQAIGTSPKTYFPFRGPLDSCELVFKLSSIIDGACTFGMYKDQNYNITKTIGMLQSSAPHNWPIRCGRCFPSVVPSSVLLQTLSPSSQ